MLHHFQLNSFLFTGPTDRKLKSCQVIHWNSNTSNWPIIGNAVYCCSLRTWPKIVPGQSMKLKLSRMKKRSPVPMLYYPHAVASYTLDIQFTEDTSVFRALSMFFQFVYWVLSFHCSNASVIATFPIRTLIENS